MLILESSMELGIVLIIIAVVLTEFWCAIVWIVLEVCKIIESDALDSKIALYYPRWCFWAREFFTWTLMVTSAYSLYYFICHDFPWLEGCSCILALLVSALSLHFDRYILCSISTNSSRMAWLLCWFLQTTLLASIALRSYLYQPIPLPVLYYTFVAVIPLQFKFYECFYLTAYPLTSSSPELTASLYSYLTFSWFNPIINSNFISETELPRVLYSDQSSVIWNEFRQIITAYPDSLLSYHLTMYSKWELVLQSCSVLISVLSNYMSPIAMMIILDYIEGTGGISKRLAIIMSVLLILGPLVHAAFDGLQMHIGRRIMFRCKSALSSSIYAKSLNIDLQCCPKSTGEVTNLLTNDVNNVEEMINYLQLLWSTPLEVIICLSMIFYLLNWCVVGAIFILIIMYPYCHWITIKFYQLSSKMMPAKDLRMGAIHESIFGIRIIKAFGWEKKFKSKIAALRETEVGLLANYLFNLFGMEVVWDSLDIIVGLSSFIVYTLIADKTLDASTSFTALILFGLLKYPLLYFPDTISYLVHGQVSLGRIELYLKMNDVRGRNKFDTKNGIDLKLNNVTFELKKMVLVDGDATHATDNTECDVCDADEVEESTSLMGHAKHGITNYESTYNCGEETETDEDDDRVFDLQSKLILPSLSLTIPHSRLTCVYGPTGCGKSSLLSGLLGEINHRGGLLETYHGAIGYVSQKPWIQNMTIRDNIVFNSNFDFDWYSKVIYACGLTADLSNMTAGDATEIGERGINLSGGQQLRVSLARAVYNRAQVYLLDDPLSALDSHVGHHVLLNCILGLLKHCTVVLVTHQVHLTFFHADLIVIFNSVGRVLVNSDGPAFVKSLCDNSNNSVVSSDSFLTEIINQVSSSTLTRNSNMMRQRTESKKIVVVLDNNKDDGEEEAKAVVGKFIKDEAKFYGAPSWEVISYYIACCGGMTNAFIFIFSMITQQVLLGLQAYALSYWISEMNADKPVVSISFYLYLLACSACVLNIVFRSFLFCHIAVLAAKKIHSNMINIVLSAYTGWFDSNSIGRIMNRFSFDVALIDKELMGSLVEFTDSFLFAVSILVVISLCVPQLIVLSISTFVICYFVCLKYLRASREIKRLDSVFKSPVVAYFAETMNGLHIIRSFQQEDIFLSKFQSLLDASIICYFSLWTSNRWLYIRLQVIASLVSGFVALYLVLSSLSSSSLSSSIAGLVLYYSLSFGTALVWAIRAEADVEMNLNSVERVKDYCDLDHEPIGDEDNMDLASPSEPSLSASLTLNDIWMAYPSCPDKYILKGISLSLPPRCKLGIVGKTGAGKSSLISILLRLTEPERRPGTSMVYGDINLLDIELSKERQLFSLVPQDATLFKGNVRSNLDPFNQHNDDDIWKALDKTHSTSFVRARGGLDCLVSDQGANFSVGQRQLLCMTRCLLKPCPILLLDEATANVDPEMDNLIQSSLAEAFNDRSVICVAHRLRTIMWFDLIAVIDDGRVVELGDPLTLIDTNDSAFQKLCKKSKNDLEFLKKIALTKRGL